VVRIIPEQPDASTIEGERKTVTALFADIKGSTELMADQLIAEGLRRVDREYRNIIHPGPPLFAIRQHEE
jgi:class 3 adenylate cyclase